MEKNSFPLDVKVLYTYISRVPCKSYPFSSRFHLRLPFVLIIGSLSPSLIHSASPHLLNVCRVSVVLFDTE